MCRCDPAALDVAKYFLSDDEREVYHVSPICQLTGRPGALLHLEDRNAPACPSCGEQIRPSEKGRFIYYRIRDDPNPRLITRFAHDRCLRKLMFIRPTDGKGMGNVWVPNYGELGSVF